MSPLPPNLSSVPSGLRSAPAATDPSTSARAAQAAFFRQALAGVAQTVAPAEPQANMAPAQTQTATQTAAQASAEPGRPGRLLDIRI